ncbi:immunoglobulin superfamily DCC subclass member 4 [Lissotriton helveticus]
MEGPWLLCFCLICACWLLTGSSEPVGVGCGVGPVQVILEPGRPLVLDCQLGPVDQPANISWWKDGQQIPEQTYVQTLPNGSLSISQAPHDLGQAEPSDSSEGSYSCVRQSTVGTVISRGVLVRLSSLSRFHQHPESQTVWEHGLAHFECSVEGLPVPVITWEKDQKSLSPDTRFIFFPSGILQIVDVQLSDAGSYRCLASNAARNLYSNEATLNVLEASSRPDGDSVAITAAPRNTTVIAGQSTVMECQAAANPPPLVSWTRQDGKPIAPDVIVLGEANLLIAHAQPHHSGVYVCRANRPHTRHFVNASAELRVLAPPVITHHPENVSRPPASTARFVCNVEGEPTPSIFWLKNGSPVLPNGRVKTPSTGSLVITQIGLEDAGYYQCIADNSLGTACATTQLSVIVREGLPSAPKGVTAVPLSSTVIVVSWERPEYNSEQIIGFSLHYQKSIGTDNIEYQFAVNNDTLEFHVKDLKPSTSYVFYVVAYSQLGASRSSSPVTVKTWDDVPEAAPQHSLSSNTPTDIHVSWLPLQPEVSNGEIIKYQIDYCTAKEVDKVYSVEVNGNETEVTLDSLHPNRAYKVRIAAGTIAGYGVPSEWMQHRTPEKFNKTHVPFAPTELKVRARLDSLLLSWLPPSNYAQISGYKLFHRAVSTDESGGEHPLKGNEESWDAGPIKLKKKQKQYEILQLVPDTMYEVKLVAYNKHEDGYAALWKGKTDKVSALETDPQVPKGPPLPPSYLEVEPRSSTAVWLKWRKPDFNSVKIVNYTVRCNLWGQQNASLVTYHTSSAEGILISGLKPYTKYEFAVQSNGLGVDGPFSSVVEQVTLPDRPSSPPMELQVNPISSYAVRVVWRPPIEPNGVIVEYIILYVANTTQPDHMWTQLTKEGNISRTEIRGLESGTRYFFKMGAKTSVGTGPFSVVKDVQTLPAKAAEVLDIHSVTGIIVGVCLGLLCILFCMCASFRNSKHRESTVGLEPQVSGTPSYCHRGRQSVGTQGTSSNSHELESLMPPRAEEVCPTPTEITELSDGHTPASTGHPEDDVLVKLKPTWNGSINPNWVNNITIYGDAKSPASTANGLLLPHTDIGKKPAMSMGTSDVAQNEVQKAGHHHPAICNRVEAEVIVHSDFSASERSCECEQSRSESEDVLTEVDEERAFSPLEEILPQPATPSPPGREDTGHDFERPEEAHQMQEELFHVDKDSEKLEVAIAPKLANGFHRDGENISPLCNRETDFLKEGTEISRLDMSCLKGGRVVLQVEMNYMEDRGSSEADKQPLLCPGLQDTSLCNISSSSNSTSASEQTCS